MIENKKLKIALLTLLPGLLFWIAWPPRDFFFLSFIAFVPLFLLEKETNGIKRSGWLIYASLLFWNIILSWWVGYAEFYSSVFMMVANAWLMYIPWWGYRKARQHFGDSKALLVLITLWLSYEYLHLNWQITWPWFTLGNVFAKHNSVVQWYEITGTMGGSLWVLLTNVFFYKTSQLAIKKWTKWIKPSLLVVIPMLISFIFLFLSSQVSHRVVETHETLIIQPNIDPYFKFDEAAAIGDVKKMLAMAESEISEKTKYVIMPETAIVEYINEDAPDQTESVKLVIQFTKKHPNIHVITGASSYHFYDDKETISETARESNGSYYDSYNTAMEVSPSGELDFYHKSKLVPGAEKMPYPKAFKFLEFLALDLGGISGSLGSDKEPKVFDAGNKPNVAPLICYESVFPEYVAKFTRRGADILLVITNDGWWRDTDGYKQHMYYACLRAIENRREVLRSANTGISCRIDRLGNIQEHTQWWEATVLKVQANDYSNLTFYTKHGDYIGRLGSFIGVFFLIGLFVKGRIRE